MEPPPPPGFRPTKALVAGGVPRRRRLAASEIGGASGRMVSRRSTARPFRVASIPTRAPVHPRRLARRGRGRQQTLETRNIGVQGRRQGRVSPPRSHGGGG